jgi:hypothetical protein
VVLVGVVGVQPHHVHLGLAIPEAAVATPEAGAAVATPEAVVATPEAGVEAEAGVKVLAEVAVEADGDKAVRR